MTDDRHPFGLPVLTGPVPISERSLALVTSGIKQLWRRIAASHSGSGLGSGLRPLILSYDIHPTPSGPVLIEVNTNAGGILTAIEAARRGNECCAEWERGLLEERLLALFKRDLLGPDPEATGVVAVVDDQLDQQALRDEMHALAELIRPAAKQVLVLDAADLTFSEGRLRYGGLALDRVYWRSTDFLLTQPEHAPIRTALSQGKLVLAPSPEAYLAIADKRRFVEWSEAPELSRDAETGMTFRLAETVPMGKRALADWYAERNDWVFKPASGYASRGVYVGKSISRSKLAQLPVDGYLAQRYAPHPVQSRDGQVWKYDLRLFADRDQLIGAAARVFQGQVVGMRTPGSGFAPIQVGAQCCLVSALSLDHCDARLAPNNQRK